MVTIYILITRCYLKFYLYTTERHLTCYNKCHQVLEHHPRGVRGSIFYTSKRVYDRVCVFYTYIRRRAIYDCYLFIYYHYYYYYHRFTPGVYFLSITKFSSRASLPNKISKKYCRFSESVKIANYDLHYSFATSS